MAPLNVGLMGYGFSTKSFHLPFILPNPDLKVYAFLQRAPAPSGKVEKGKHCTVDYPAAKHYQTADEFFADPNIDIVIVCTHHDTHAEFAEKALLAGKHAVVEKPFTVSTEEADRVIAASKKSGRILTVFQILAPTPSLHHTSSSNSSRSSLRLRLPHSASISESFGIWKNYRMRDAL
ncbi:NAD(P)-binding protein [Acephala macrosclerotiorum]|nr:NAD(P)-binding protein [Acephala macrosclerotiorum]